MKRYSILFIVAFLVVNFFLTGLHFMVFKSPYPLLTPFSATIHFVALLYFPYQKFIQF